MPFRRSARGVGRRTALLALGALLILGCGKGKDGDPQPTGGDPSQPGAQASEDPKPEATVAAAALYKDIEKYSGKWVVVIARTPRIHIDEYPDGRKEATVDLLGDDGRADSLAKFESDQWAKAPKFEDGVRYEILGFVGGSKSTGGRLTKARVVGVSKAEGPAASATLTAGELLKNPAAHKGKVILVKGVVKTGATGSGGVGGALMLGGEGNKLLVCRCAPGEFEKALKAGRGASAELKGTLTEAGSFPAMSDCTVVKITAAGRTEKAAAFTKAFAENPEAAAKANEDRAVTVTGKVESAEARKLVLAGFRDSKKGKPLVPQKLVAHFGPDWKAALAGVKVGDDVTVSGEYSSYSPGEVTLNGCWLLPK
jgi:hypothetical protein